MSSAKKVHISCRKKWEHARRFWQPQNDMYGRLMSFCLDLEHYRMSEGLTKDRRRIQPKTQRQYNLIRHKASLLLRQMPQFDTHAVQPGADAHAAEVSRRVIENIFYDPIKVYHDSRSRMVWSGLAGGRGVVGVDWHPKWGVCFGFRDPRRVHIQPGYTFMHNPLNPCVHEEVPMRLSEVQKMRASGWSVPSDLNPDNWRSDYADGSSHDSKRSDIYGEDGREPMADEFDGDDGQVTVLKSWYREDPYQRMVKAQRNSDLPEDEWHWVDDALGVNQQFDPSSPVPPMSEATGAPLRLVTNKSEDYEFGEYPDGYLVITAPFYKGEKPLFEGKWLEGALNEDATLPVFPYGEFVGYRHPLRRTGISDTELTHSLTIVDNSSFRSTYEQMSVAGGVLAALKGSLEDSEGKPFRFSSDPLNIAWATDQLGLNGIQCHQAPGMNAAMPAFRNMIESQWQHIGTGDFGGQLGPDRSKDIAVGTANILQQTGDLPVQLHAQDLSLQESLLAVAALSLARAYMGDQVVSWVTDEGEAAYSVVRGSDLVSLNVTVRADKEWQQKDVDKAQAMAQFLGMVAPLQLPPNVIGILLKEAGFSAEAVSALSQNMQPPSGNAGPPGTPAGSGPPEMALVQGGAPQ